MTDPPKADAVEQGRGSEIARFRSSIWPDLEPVRAASPRKDGRARGADRGADDPAELFEDT